MDPLGRCDMRGQLHFTCDCPLFLFSFAIAIKKIVEGVKNMTRGLEVKVNDLKLVTAEVLLFSGQKWRIENGRAFRYVTIFDDGKPQRVDFDSNDVSAIFGDIKILSDHKKRIVAQRLNRNCRLLTTRNNKWFKVKKNTQHTRELAIYTLISGIEENEFIKKMNSENYVK